MRRTLTRFKPFPRNDYTPSMENIFFVPPGHGSFRSGNRLSAQKSAVRDVTVTISLTVFLSINTGNCGIPILPYRYPPQILSNDADKQNSFLCSCHHSSAAKPPQFWSLQRRTGFGALGPGWKSKNTYVVRDVSEPFDHLHCQDYLLLAVGRLQYLQRRPNVGLHLTHGVGLTDER